VETEESILEIWEAVERRVTEMMCLLIRITGQSVALGWYKG